MEEVKDIQVVSPEGEIGTVPQENLAAAKEQGFTLPTPEELTAHHEKQIYGNRFLTAGLAGAVKGALPFGAGAAALRVAGLDKETQKKLEEHNPASSTTGELVGSFTPGTGLLKIAGKAGKLASGLSKLVHLGEDAGVAGKIASAAVRGGAEGAVFGSSHVANDAVLGDPSVVAGHALNEIGTSALWGAGIGGGLGLASVGLPKGIAAAKQASGKITDVLGLSSGFQAVKNAGKETFASISSAVSKVPKEKILEAFENMGREEAPLKAREFADSLQTLHRSLDDSLREAVNNYESFTPETQQAIGDYLKSVDTTKGTGDFARQFMYKSKGELKIDAGKVETFLKNTRTAKGAKSADAFADYLHSSENLLDHLNHESLLGASEASPDFDLIKNLVVKNKGVLEEQEQAAMSASLAKHGEGSGGVGEFLGATAVGHLLGIPHGAVEAGAAVFEGLRNPIETIHKLGQLQQTISKSAQRIERMASYLATSDTRAGTAVKGLLASKIASRDKYDKITKEIQGLNENLMSSTDAIHAKTAILEPHAPSVVSALRDTAGRAIGFLASKIAPMTPPGPLARNPEPSRAQIAAFNRYYQAVERPMSVMEGVKTGSITHESIEALTVVHPALYAQMKTAVMKSLSDNHKKVKELPYSQKLMLSLFLGQDLDGSTNPLSMQMNQAMLEISGQQAEAKEQAFIGQPKPTVGGLEDLSGANRALTAQQASAQRSNT